VCGARCSQQAPAKIPLHPTMVFHSSVLQHLRWRVCGKVISSRMERVARHSPDCSSSLTSVCLSLTFACRSWNTRDQMGHADGSRQTANNSKRDEQEALVLCNIFTVASRWRPVSLSFCVLSSLCVIDCAGRVCLCGAGEAVESWPPTALEQNEHNDSCVAVLH